MCVKKYILSISLTHKAELKRTLIRYPVGTSIRGRRRRPIRLNNKGEKHLISNSLALDLFIKKAIVYYLVLVLVLVLGSKFKSYIVLLALLLLYIISVYI